MAGRVVLVVEDTELLRRMYVDKLMQDGYEVLAAADGLEALSVLKTQEVDLILLDLVMPRMSGLEVLDTVKADPRTANIPVLVLSNLGQESDVQKGIELGAADYLVKNEARPADVSAKISAVFANAACAPAEEGGAEVETITYRVYLRDHEGDIDSIVDTHSLQRRLWCVACEEELVLELVPQCDRPGWFDAHLECPKCHRGF